MAGVADAKTDRSKFLQKLAKNPAEALRHWGRLTQEEKVAVTSQMSRVYDQEFAKIFRERADRDPRPDASIQHVNDPTLTTAKLRSQGYRFLNDSGGVRKYIHYSGKELWITSNPKSGSPTPAQAPTAPRPTGPPPTHPDVEDARNWASTLTARRAELWEKAFRLRQSKSPSGSYPADAYNEYFRELNRFHNDLKSVIEEEAPQWGGSTLTDDEQKELQKQLQTLKDLLHYPPEMEELGTF